MTGLKNRIITIEFPELTEDGEPPLYVSFRNPRLVPLDWLRSNLAVGPDGRPLDQDAATEESYGRIARLMTGIRMYDAEDLAEDQALLDMPMTPDKVRRMPMEVNNRIVDEFGRLTATPTTTPDSTTS